MLDVQELIRNDKPIYVLNKTNRYLEKRGPHVLEIKDGNKRVAKIIIPATKYPFLLSGHVPPKLLAESTEFYDALSKGILELVDPDEAKRIMADPIAKDVVDTAMRKFQPTVRTINPPPELVAGNKREEDDRVPPGTNRGISMSSQADERSGDLTMRVAGDDGDGPSGTVEQIVMDLESDPDLESEKFNELAGLDLTEADLGYLMLKCKAFPKIISWAKKELANLVGDDEVEKMEAEQEIDEMEEKLPPAKKRRTRRKRK
jgi:hypothetical protein